MLDPWIIEEIRRREQEERERHDRRPVLEIPLETPAQHPRTEEVPSGQERGVVIIDCFA